MLQIQAHLSQHTVNHTATVGLLSNGQTQKTYFPEAIRQLGITLDNLANDEDDLCKEQEEDDNFTDDNDAQPENEDNQPIISGHATYYWSKEHINPETEVDAFKLFQRPEMPLNRFKFLLSCMRFENYRNRAKQQEIDCLIAVREIWDTIQ